MKKLHISIREEEAFDLIIKVEEKEPNDVYTDLGRMPDGTPINVTTYEFDTVVIHASCPCANYNVGEIFND